MEVQRTSFCQGGVIDTTSATQHPKRVSRLLRRVVAGLVLALLAGGDAAVCAGWESSPEARMACCVKDDACPMHHDAAGSAKASARINQGEADRCCAGSERPESAPSPNAFVAVIALPVVVDLFVAEPRGERILPPASRDDGPPPPGRVSQQALLSVFQI